MLKVQNPLKRIHAKGTTKGVYPLFVVSFCIADEENIFICLWSYHLARVLEEGISDMRQDSFRMFVLPWGKFAGFWATGTMVQGIQ